MKLFIAILSLIVIVCFPLIKGIELTNYLLFAIFIMLILIALDIETKNKQ